MSGKRVRRQVGWGMLLLAIVLFGPGHFPGLGAATPRPFPLGWYSGAFFSGDPDVTLPAKIAAEGYNTLLLYSAQACEEGECKNIRKSHLGQLLANARKSNVTVYLEVKREYVQRGEPNKIARFVREYKDVPGVGGWYLYDEPELARRDGRYLFRERPELLTDAYRAIKAQDSQHPVMIAHYGRSTRARIPTRSLTSAADIFLIDYYTIFIPPDCPSADEFGCATFLRDLQPDLRQFNDYYVGERKKPPIIPILQGSGESLFKKRNPTYRETRYYVFDALQVPASGLLFWWWDTSTPSWRKNVLNPILEELRPYFSRLSARVNERLVADNANFHYQVFGDGSGGYFLLATNPSLSPRSTTFRPARGPVKKVTCDGKTIAVRENRFTLSLDRFGATLCTF